MLRTWKLSEPIEESSEAGRGVFDEEEYKPYSFDKLSELDPIKPCSLMSICFDFVLCF